MSTIKISQLPLVTTFTANTQNTVFVGVDLDADLTGQFTAQAIARNLYLNNTLIVGNNVVQFDNVIGQFSGSSPTYLQINNQNFNANGSADYVASTSDSDNTFGFVDMGIESASYNGVAAGYPAFKPYDGYLYMVGKTTTSPTGNLIIGTQNKANTVFAIYFLILLSSVPTTLISFISESLFTSRVLPFIKLNTEKQEKYTSTSKRNSRVN